MMAYCERVAIPKVWKKMDDTGRVAVLKRTTRSPSTDQNKINMTCPNQLLMPSDLDLQWKGRSLWTARSPRSPNLSWDTHRQPETATRSFLASLQPSPSLCSIDLRLLRKGVQRNKFHGRQKHQFPLAVNLCRPAENEKIKTNLELWAQDSILVIWMWNPRKIEKQTSSGFRSSNDASFLWEDSPKLRPMELVAAYLRRNFLVAGSNIIQWLWIAIGHLWLSTLR